MKRSLISVYLPALVLLSVPFIVYLKASEQGLQAPEQELQALEQGSRVPEQEPRAPEQGPRTPEQRPRAVLQETVFDAGSAREGTRVSHDFRVLNRGDAPLEILRVRPG